MTDDKVNEHMYEDQMKAIIGVNEYE